MALKLNFKIGSESSSRFDRKGFLSADQINGGEVYFTASDDGYGKIWYKDNNNKVRNIIPHVVDCGSWGYTFHPECCFVAGTKVLLTLAGDEKNIEDIRSGDTVVSYNVLTSELYTAKVKSLIINKNSRKMAKVYFDNGLTLEMTEYHPLLTENGFHSLTNHKGYETLTVKDKVKTINGFSGITKIERYELEQPIVTYNLDVIDFDEIEDNEVNDVFIANGFMVHNATCPI